MLQPPDEMMFGAPLAKLEADRSSAPLSTMELSSYWLAQKSRAPDMSSFCVLTRSLGQVAGGSGVASAASCS
ncbi:hypothetical protein D3C83_125570 [compost metagenome]